MGAGQTVIRDACFYRPNVGPTTSKGNQMTKLNDLHEEWMKDPEYSNAYKALNAEFAMASDLVRARASAAMTQEQAEAMGTGRQLSSVSKLESPCPPADQLRAGNTTPAAEPDMTRGTIKGALSTT
jgi:hypothetical protein